MITKEQIAGIRERMLENPEALKNLASTFSMSEGEAEKIINDVLQHAESSHPAGWEGPGAVITLIRAKFALHAGRQ